MKFKNMLAMNLHLFEGGAAAGAGAGAAAAGNGGETGDTNGAVPGHTRRGRLGEFDNVVFGKQDAGAAAAGTVTNAQEQPHAAGGATDQGVQTTSDTLEARRKAYMDLVNSAEYKDIHSNEMQRVLNRRFAETRNLEAQVQAQQPIIDMLAQRYNVQGGDTKQLMDALENDNAYWSEAAEDAGMTVEQYKKFRKLQRDNAALLAAQQGQQRRDMARQQAQRWFQESEALKAKFPKFDLSAEMQDPAFMSMLRSGTPVEHAYKIMHFDELMTDAVSVTAADTERRVVGNVRAKGTRPTENGTAAQSAFTIRDDVSKLSKKERAEIARRALRGDEIHF